jgi:hypothetical protein
MLMKKLSYLFLGLCCIASNAFAEDAGSLVYVPTNSQSIPALSNWMLLVLALLIFVAAFRVTRGKISGTPLSIITALITATVVYATGTELLSDAHANLTPIVNLTNPSGGTVPISGGTLNEYTNTSGIALTISSITLPSFCPEFPHHRLNECSENLSLAPNDSCEIYCGGG